MYNPQLTTFVSVAKNGSFTKASDELFLTPTAVMKQINALEERLGITLFARTNHGLELTEAGERFLQDAKYVIEYSVRAVEKAKEIANKDHRQSIRIGTSIMTPAKFLLDAWTEIRKRRRDMSKKIVQTAGRTALGTFAPEFAHYNDDVLFGENWNNADIDVKTRCLLTVVSLMSQGICDSSLKHHLTNAKNNGVTQKEIAAAT